MANYLITLIIDHSIHDRYDLFNTHDMKITCATANAYLLMFNCLLTFSTLRYWEKTAANHAQSWFTAMLVIGIRFLLELSEVEYMS